MEATYEEGHAIIDDVAPLQPRHSDSLSKKHHELEQSQADYIPIDNVLPPTPIHDQQATKAPIPQPVADTVVTPKVPALTNWQPDFRSFETPRAKTNQAVEDSTPPELATTPATAELPKSNHGFDPYGLYALADTTRLDHLEPPVAIEAHGIGDPEPKADDKRPLQTNQANPADGPEPVRDVTGGTGNKPPRDGDKPPTGGSGDDNENGNDGKDNPADRTGKDERPDEQQEARRDQAEPAKAIDTREVVAAQERERPVIADKREMTTNTRAPGSQFLHERNPQLHASQEVEDVAAYLRTNGENIPNEPAEKISAHLGFLANKAYVNDGILTGNQESIDRQIDAHVIKAKDVPESYFELQRRIAREQGHGDVEITPDMQHQMIEAVQADQHVGLSKWVEYLGGDDGGYPDWFKTYTWESVVKLGNYDKDKQEFGKRSRGTTAAYPELNREALAYVYDVLNKSRVQGEAVDGGANNEQLQKHLRSGNFGKLYAHAVMEVTPDSPELRKDTRGSWTMFHQTDDPRTARRLSGSLQGHGTGWCTAGESTAAMQLSAGDFYVYYTRDEDGKDTVPRVAVRMEDDQVAEVRGVNAAQELEPEMADIVVEKLQGLPGGEEYTRKAEDMKRLTAIEKKTLTDPDTELTRDEVKFLYEFNHTIEGFGYQRDPRIDEVRAKRGELDYAELKILAVEHVREGFDAAYGGLAALLPHLEQATLADKAALAQAYEAKLAEWDERGVLDYVTERIITHGELFTPVMTPNMLASYGEIRTAAEEFGRGQPYQAWFYDELYRHYTPLELSGQPEPNQVVRFSLIPNKTTAELGYDSVDDQRYRQARLETATPNLHLHVPSVLDSVSYWYALRARGDKLNDSSAFDKTYIRHLDLEPKRLGRWLGVPDSCVGVVGRPGLFYSVAEDGDGARLAVG